MMDATDEHHTNRGGPDLPGPRTVQLLVSVNAQQAAARTGIGGDGAQFLASRRTRGAVDGARVRLAALRRRGPVPGWAQAVPTDAVPVVGRDG